jgi:Carboxypeptidase regulatory-like domain
MIVVVEDPNGAVVPGATVSVVNTATGATREAVAGDNGIASFSALSLTGAYTVTVSKSGFANQELTGVTLRSGETATVKVKLAVGAEKAEVTVYGTTEGVRADLQIGLPLESQRRRLSPADRKLIKITPSVLNHTPIFPETGSARV